MRSAEKAQRTAIRRHYVATEALQSNAPNQDVAFKRQATTPKSKSEVFADAGMAIGPLSKLVKFVTFRNSKGEALFDELRDGTVGLEFQTAIENGAPNSTNAIVGLSVLSHVKKTEKKTPEARITGRRKTTGRALLRVPTLF